MFSWRAVFGARHKDGHSTKRAKPRSKAGKSTHLSQERNTDSPIEEDEEKRGPGGGGDVVLSSAASRLGRNHLGKFAHEKRMPTWLTKQLDKDGQVCTPEAIPALQRLLRQSHRTEFAYTSDYRVVHVSKLHREGGFCGYRNIQSLTSFIVATKAPGHEHFDLGIPSVFQIQDLIESAWDQGFNSRGRTETGGIKGTRKYIGTPEAQALFCGLGIPCSVEAFRPADGRTPWQDLMTAVTKYFIQGWSAQSDEKIKSTTLPPIYLQHKGHSMTIIGIEKQGDGSWHLLVFDPSNRDPESIKVKNRNSVKKQKKYPQFDLLLEPYRRGGKYLSKYDEFEVL